MNTESFPTRISFEQAEQILAGVAAAARLPVERVSPAMAAGRILAEDIDAGADFPGFDNSAMDGFALRSSDLDADAGVHDLELVGEQFAGLATGARIGPGQCLRVTTGAMMPEGADAVVMKELAEQHAGRVRIKASVVAGQHVRRQGEDVRRGERVLRAGDLLTPAGVSLAVAVGHSELPVHRRPTVALFTTGDELRAPGITLKRGEIHDSNRALLQGLLLAEGFQPVTWPVLADDPTRIATALGDAAEAFDVVITCGGVSAGEKDHIPAWLATAGKVHFWKVRMRPGMPVLAGQVAACQFLGLPGNPVSVFATWLTLGRPFLDALQGRREPRTRWFARLELPVGKHHDRLEFLRGCMRCDSNGQLHVSPDPADGSHRLRAAAAANCLLLLPEGVGQWQAGQVVEVLPLSAAGGA